MNKKLSNKLTTMNNKSNKHSASTDAFTSSNKFTALGSDNDSSDNSDIDDQFSDSQSSDDEVDVKPTKTNSLKDKNVKVPEKINKEANEEVNQESVKNIRLPVQEKEEQPFSGFKPKLLSNEKMQTKQEWKQPAISKKDKLLCDENTINSEEFGNNLYLSSNWTVWCHRADCDTWTKNSYINLYTIKNIGSFWRFFNNFHLIDKVSNQLFIMRDQIYPIWEDNNNRQGGICSLKIDCYNGRNKSDIGSEVMTCLSLLMMNETLVPQNNDINGISFTVKTKPGSPMYSVLIKIWCRDYKVNIKDKLPIAFIEKLNSVVRVANKGSYMRGPDSGISKIYKPIKPEYDMPE